MERVHFDENGNWRDCIGGKTKRKTMKWTK